MYIYIYTRIYIYIYMYTYVHVYIHVCIPLVISVSVKKTFLWEEEGAWKNEPSEHQLRGWIAASAAGLPGKGLQKRNVFSRHWYQDLRSCPTRSQELRASAEASEQSCAFWRSALQTLNSPCCPILDNICPGSRILEM